MKPKKQNIGVGHPAKRNSSNVGIQSQPIAKQFMMYRTVDKMASSGEMEEVIFVKRRRIVPTEQSVGEGRKNGKKCQNSTKRKTEEKGIAEEIHDDFPKRKDIFLVTKSTMPSSTLGTFKKASFTETLKQKVEPGKCGIRKVNNLYSSSSISRHISKEEKIWKKKLSAKSPSKLMSPGRGKSVSPLKGKKVEQKNNLKGKNGKYKTEENDKNYRKKQKQENEQYVFLDGHYLPMQIPISLKLTQKMFYNKPQTQVTNPNTQFTSQSAKSTQNFGHIPKLSKETQQSQQNERDRNDHDNVKNIEKEEQQEKEELNHRNLLVEKVGIIQKWWRECRKRKRQRKCGGNENDLKVNIEQTNLQTMEVVVNDRQSKQIYQSISNDCPLEAQMGWKSFIEAKHELLVTSMQTHKNVLQKLLQLNKIDGQTFSNGWAKVQSNFQKEMLGINKLKIQIEAEAIKTQQLKSRLKEQSAFMGDIENLPTKVVLEQFLPRGQQSTSIEETTQNKQCSTLFQRQKSTGCHYSSLSEQETRLGGAAYRKGHSPKEDDSSDVGSLVKEEGVVGEGGKLDDGEGDRIELQNRISQTALDELFSMYSDRQQAQIQYQRRHTIQLGITQGIHKPGSIATSALSIHNFLTSFLKFYQYFYRDEFLKLINLPFVINQSSRLKKLQGYTLQNWKRNSQVDQQAFFEIKDIIGQQILEDFQRHSFQVGEDAADIIKNAVQYEKIHQRAIIECFNQALNCFRPYYFINGAPYLWNYSQRALTFYYITQQNIPQVFQKTRYKVLKWGSCLCGTIVESLMLQPGIKEEMSLQEKLVKYREAVNVVLAEGREEKLAAVEKIAVEETNYSWENYQEDKTSVLLQISNSIMAELIFEVLLYQPVGSVIECGISSECQNSDNVGSPSLYLTPVREFNESGGELSVRQCTGDGKQASTAQQVGRVNEYVDEDEMKDKQIRLVTFENQSEGSSRYRQQQENVAFQ